MTLFILKRNEVYSFVSYCRRSSGLWNSTRFIVESLNSRGEEAVIVEVDDNNDIDREITKWKPETVVIEALWVVPEKFHELRRLHRHVKWSVHLHSHMPFLALEGIAMDWIRRYANQGIQIIANSPESYDALRCYLPVQDLIYLPNVYLSKPRKPKNEVHDIRLHIGCFGALRPMKNQLLQALASIRFAREEGKHLFFHINASRVETGGDPVLKNLIQLFEGEKHATLILEDWYEPEDFLNLLEGRIDLGMQVSLTETFNVVCADYVTAGVPVVASKEVKWLSTFTQAQDDSVEDIIKIMRRSLGNRLLARYNQRLLLKHSRCAQQAWYQWSLG